MSKTAIGVFTPEDARSIKAKVLNDDHSYSLHDYKGKVKLGWHYVVLREELLPVPCDPLADPTQASAAVLMYETTADSLVLEEVVEEEFELTITNRSPYLSYAVGDIVLVRWVVKEWVVVNAPLKRLQAVLQGNLNPATNTIDDPSTAPAKVLIKNEAGDMKLLNTEFTVVSRFQNITVLAGTYIKIEYIDGEWQPYAADCAGESAFSSSQAGSDC